MLPLILASSSPARLALLENINITPDAIYPANINEEPKEKELPTRLAVRLAEEKALAVSKNYSDAYILAADTVTACGRMILPKAETDKEVEDCLHKLSGRRHKVYTGVTLLKVENGNIVQKTSKLVTTIIRFKNLEQSEIAEYIASKQGLGKSGGCNIEGLAASFVIWISGSYTNIIGLPLYETKLLLNGFGYKKGI